MRWPHDDKDQTPLTPYCTLVPDMGPVPRGICRNHFPPRVTEKEGRISSREGGASAKPQKARWPRAAPLHLKPGSHHLLLDGVMVIRPHLHLHSKSIRCVERP